jgi:DNA-binding winged helix-turn-helix (wHTH) protein
MSLTSKSFRFGSFELKISYDEENPHVRHYDLLGRKKKKVEKRTLEVLEVLLEHADKMVTDARIASAVWGDDSAAAGNIDQQIHRVREALGESAKASHFIQTIVGFGYRFTQRPEIIEAAAKEVARQLTIKESWNRDLFTRFLGGTIRAKETDRDGDLRILTTAFHFGVPEILTELLNRGVHIKILLSSPEIYQARNLVRQDGFTPQKALKMRQVQLERIDAIRKRQEPGKLEVLETNQVVPTGIVIHNSRGALLGIFPATESYVEGPIIEVGRETKLWQLLFTDWKFLWDRASKLHRRRK